MQKVKKKIEININKDLLQLQQKVVLIKEKNKNVADELRERIKQLEAVIKTKDLENKAKDLEIRNLRVIFILKSSIQQQKKEK